MNSTQTLLGPFKGRKSFGEVGGAWGRTNVWGFIVHLGAASEPEEFTIINKIHIFSGQPTDKQSLAVLWKERSRVYNIDGSL